MKCKNKACDLESMHKGQCRRVVNSETEIVVNNAPEIDVSTSRCEVVGRLEQGSEVRIKMGRQTAWQQANKDRYNAKMRDYMRARRAKA